MARAPASNGAETRSRLMAASVAAFAAKGFHGTSTRDIAAAAGLSPAAVYVHYESKEELLYLLARSGHAWTLEVTTESQVGLDCPTDQLQAWVSAFVGHHAREHTTARVVNYELRALRAEHWSEIRDLRRALDRQLVDIIERGRSSGEFGTTDSQMAAITIDSLGIDVARWYRPGRSPSPDEIGIHHARVALGVVQAGTRGCSCGNEPEGIPRGSA